MYIHSRKQCFRTILGMSIVCLLIAFCFAPPIRQVYNLPAHTILFTNELQTIAARTPYLISAKITPRRPAAEEVAAFTSPPMSQTSGQGTINFKLFGAIPLRTVQYDILPPIKVVPGGQSIGASLHSRGVLVVGFSPVPTSAQSTVNPALDAGLQIGDVILSINNTYMCTENQLADTINEAGKDKQPVEISVQRGNAVLSFSLAPRYCPETGRYRMGLLVRDGASGIGTLTFYETNSRIYGAIGHRITDSDTLQPIDTESGNVVLAAVQSIEPGTFGRPGEKIGIFTNDDTIRGDVQKNSELGIYGKLSIVPPNELYPEAIAVASRVQIEQGPAEILTVIEGSTIERFSIDIEKVNVQDYPASKGLVIKVTDPILLAKTGGIVQGMSGSPIIQNNKLVGAVTHVFVNDPTKGYGCFADWMLMESGLIPKIETHDPTTSLFRPFPRN